MESTTTTTTTTTSDISPGGGFIEELEQHGKRVHAIRNKVDGFREEVEVIMKKLDVLNYLIAEANGKRKALGLERRWILAKTDNLQSEHNHLIDEALATIQKLRAGVSKVATPEWLLTERKVEDVPGLERVV